MRNRSLFYSRLYKKSFREAFENRWYKYFIRRRRVFRVYDISQVALYPATCLRLDGFAGVYLWLPIARVSNTLARTQMSLPLCYANAPVIIIFLVLLWSYMKWISFDDANLRIFLLSFDQSRFSEGTIDDQLDDCRWFSLVQGDQLRGASGTR